MVYHLHHYKYILSLWIYLTHSSVVTVLINGLKLALSGNIMSDSKASKEGGMYTSHNDSSVIQVTVRDAIELVRITRPTRVTAALELSFVLFTCDNLPIT